MNLPRHNGYTLIEIMLAVAILAIIAALAIPAYQGYILESRYGTALQDMRQMQLIMDDLASDNDLVALDANSTDRRGVYMASDGSIVLGDEATAPAGSTAWLDPWGNIYRYQRPPNAACDTARTYCIWSFGPDGANNNGDIDGSDDAAPT